MCRIRGEMRSYCWYLEHRCDLDKSSAVSLWPGKILHRFNLPLWVKWDGVCVHAQHTRCGCFKCWDVQGLSGGDPVMALRRRSILRAHPSLWRRGQASAGCPFPPSLDLFSSQQMSPPPRSPRASRSPSLGMWQVEPLPATLWRDLGEDQPRGGCGWTGRAGCMRAWSPAMTAGMLPCRRTGGWLQTALGRLVSLLTCSLFLLRIMRGDYSRPLSSA